MYIYHAQRPIRSYPCPHPYPFSGTIAQWYFNPNGVSSSTRIMTSLKHAVGPQFGSVCESGLILTVIQVCYMTKYPRVGVARLHSKYICMYYGAFSRGRKEWGFSLSYDESIVVS